MDETAERIRVMCPCTRCRAVLVVPATARGKNVRCPACNTLFKVPAKPPRPAKKPKDLPAAGA